jgi:hypothetical protein
MTVKHRARRAGAIVATIAAIGLAASSAALAKPATVVQSTQQASEKVTVVSVDLGTRYVVVRKENGETTSLKAPPEVRNLANLKPGDTITATYTLATEFALSPPNKPLPEDTDTIIAARAQQGELPAAIIANRVVVTGAVLAINTQANTLKVVSPQGGQVHTFVVASPEGRRLMGQLKPGDKITAYITESLLISTEAS